MSAADAAWLDAFMAAEALPPAFADIVEAVWRPLAGRIAQAAEGRGPGFIVGLCGAQGSGKSTAAAVLVRLLEDQGLTAVSLSIDDFYLTREERLELAARVHPLFAVRGPPGAHDVALAHTVFDALAKPGETALPRFDKAADTRKPPDQWDRVSGPVDVILFEGWCVGARAQPRAALAEPVNALERERDPDGVWRGYVNAQLEGPYRKLFERIDRLVLIQAPGFKAVLAWRREQERKLRERLAREGRDPALAMSDEAVADFIAYYERVTRHILAEMPGRADEVIRLDADRRPVGP
ncbi:kinase [Phenylobacterium sp.]|uniref:kinase n=1 Tax=Phenylobacterium sp. TaxID=1871053 RepID=UPI0035AE1E8A